MISSATSNRLPDDQRIVITGIGLTAPNGDCLGDFRGSLLQGVSGVSEYEIRYFGKTFAGVCNFDVRRHQSRKDARRGTRAGSIGVYCANETVLNSGLDWENIDKDRVGIYIGVTEHGNVETENEIYEISNFDYDTKFWSHHHNPRTVANNPAGEIAINMGITGPHYTIGAACAAGNAGLIQGRSNCVWMNAMWPLRVGCRKAFIPLVFLRALPVRVPWPPMPMHARLRDPSMLIATGLSWPRVDVCMYWKGCPMPVAARLESTGNWQGMP